MLEGYWFHLWKYVLLSEKKRVKSFMIHSFTQILHLFEIQTWEMWRWLRIFCHSPNSSRESVNKNVFLKSSQGIYVSWINASKAFTIEGYSRKRKTWWIHLHLYLFPVSLDLAWNTFLRIYFYEVWFRRVLCEFIFASKRFQKNMCRFNCTNLNLTSKRMKRGSSSKKAVSKAD